MKSILGLSPCDGGSFIFLVVFSIIIGLVSFYSYKKLKKERELKEYSDYPLDTSDLKWNAKVCIKLAAISGFTGMAAGIFGLGGGLIYNPILLSLG